MGAMKQKSRVTRQGRRVQQHKRSILGISAVILLLIAVVAVSGVSLRAKNQTYIAQERELKAEIAEEEDRAEEISDLESYVGTNEYVEQTAREKLGLIHENEILFESK